MNTTSTLKKNGSIHCYPLFEDANLPRSRGRKPNKIHNTMVNMRVGQKFFYPYTTPMSVYRKARQINIEVSVYSADGGFWVGRVC